MSATEVARPRRSRYDYRMGARAAPAPALANDSSLFTYMGHRVMQTLIRCYFSPAFSTGQRYIYTGSYDGYVYSTSSPSVPDLDDDLIDVQYSTFSLDRWCASSVATVQRSVT